MGRQEIRAREADGSSASSFVDAAAAPQHSCVGDGLDTRARPAYFSEGSDRKMKSG